MAAKGRGQGPKPEDVLARYLQATGESSPVPRGVETKTSFAIGGVCLDQFAVRQRWNAGAFHEQELTAPIGRYDPVTEQWQFAPEFVKPQDFARLRRFAARRVTDLRTTGALRQATAGIPVTDMYHPYTHKIRTELAGIMHRWTVADFLARPAVRRVIEGQKGTSVTAIGGYTQAYPIIGEFFRHREITQVNASAEPGTAALPPPPALNSLVLRVADVRLEHPDGLSGTVRDSCDSLLATRSPDNPDLWVPNRVLEPVSADVPVMVDVLTTLARAQEQPGFSVRASAIVLGGPKINFVVRPT